MTNNQLTESLLQELYSTAVSCEVAERAGAYMASFDLLCKADDSGGVAHLVRKLIDELRAARAELQERRKAAMDSEPVAWMVIDIETGEKIIRRDKSYFEGTCHPLYRHAQPAPVVTFYRDGIEAAAKWIDQQREAYDSEHGWSDPDTGAFEFGNDAQRDYSSTLEELAEGIRALHPNAGMQPAPVVLDERTAFNAWNNEDNLPIAGVGAKNAAWLAWQARAMLQAEPVTTANKLGNTPVIPDCWCRTCRPVALNDMRFVVCPDCGNKRCPRANDHRNSCTWSNEPGQEGSAYPAAPQEVKAERKK
ncbi:hypothetical protein [Klebsiella aerogenes]|uniref:hypothetical protein n=1 Tax=Klebsiella aerogenes TaxID=548 RepID=UPI0025A32B8B|nr:hypothetical protein [Klebsiella aerogenes]MDM8056565.1 hypothetical protein [Klebsiella aerogenes]MDM8080635.1 hypothetical protein [Klebsiella aerogenes]